MSGQARYAEAEPVLVAGGEGLLKQVDALPAVDTERATEALDQLVQLYTAWGKPEQAAEWQKKLDEFKAREAARAASR